MSQPPNHIVQDARRRANHAPIQRYDLFDGDGRYQRNEVGMLPILDGQYVRYDDIKHLLPRAQAAPNRSTMDHPHDW